MSDVDEIAKKILDAARERGKGMVIVDREYEALEYDIVDALRAEREKVAAIAKNDAQDSAASGRISHDEARQMLSRFINSHFGNPGEKARATIPARPEFDDDLRMSAYIQQQRERDAKFAAFVDENGEPLKVVEAYEDETNGPWHGRTVFVCERPAAEAAKGQRA